MFVWLGSHKFAVIMIVGQIFFWRPLETHEGWPYSHQFNWHDCLNLHFVIFVSFCFGWHFVFHVLLFLKLISFILKQNTFSQKIPLKKNLFKKKIHLESLESKSLFFKIICNHISIGLHHFQFSMKILVLNKTWINACGPK